MVAIRRYGSTLGAGTTITEKLAEVAITPSPLGVVAWAGILEKGPVNELIEVVGKSSWARQCGGRIPESYLPDCAEDFWDSSKGAGRMYLRRVTDGTERVAEIILKSREYTGAVPGPGRWRDVIKVKAKSAGRWAGAFNRRIGTFTFPAGLTDTTLTTGLTMLKDEFAGATLTLAGVAGRTFEVIGNTIAGIVTVKPDSQMSTLFVGTNYTFTLFKNNLDSLGNEKVCEILVKDGARDPVNEFGLEVYWNGIKVLEYADLSQDPDSDVYFLKTINDDSGNFEIEVEDLFTGTVAPVARPANQAGVIPVGGVGAIVLTLQWYQSYFDAGNTGVGALSGVTVRASTQQDFITLTCTDAAVPGSEVWSVESTNQDATLPDATTAVAYVWPNDYGVNFTIGVGAPAWDVGDKIYLTLEPASDEAVGGRLFYNTTDSPRDSLEIVAATPGTVSVRPGNDLTALTDEGKPYRLQYREGMSKGYDGHSGVLDNNYISVFDPDASLFNRLRNKQLGLIKFAVPGVASVDVQKACRSYAEANNGMFREEIPSGTVTELTAVAWVEDTMGRNDMAEVIFPSWYYKKDPDRAGLKLVPLTGSVQGIEALTAYSWQGYHKAAAGVSAVIEKCTKIPTLDTVINDEITNPKGIQVVLKKEGNWVIWGDRIPATSTGLKFKHKREQLSHYERVLFENFDWIVFAINDPESQSTALAALQAYFLPEWKPKRALRGNTFAEACSLKVDNEINTDLIRSQGDLNAEIKLRLADTVERFNITISPMGIFESVG